MICCGFKKNHHYLKDLDLVVTEASFVREGGMIRRDKKTGKPYGHMGVPNLIRFFEQFTNTICFMHFGSWFYALGARKARQKLQHLGKKYGMHVYVGYDGMVIDVKDL